jgi:hypothetical protein
MKDAQPGVIWTRSWAAKGSMELNVTSIKGLQLGDQIYVFGEIKGRRLLASTRLP